MEGSALPPPSDDHQTDTYDNSTYAGSADQPARSGTVTFPRISDYWPEENGPRPAATSARPADDGPRPAATSAPPVPGSAAPKRARLRLIAGAAGAVLVLSVGGVALARLGGGDEDPAPSPPAAADPGIIVGGTPNPPVSIAPAPPSAAVTTPPASAPAAPASPTAPPGPAFAAGTFVLASDLTELNVTLGRPSGNGVARVGSPDGSGVVPDADLDGTTLELTARKKGDEDGSGQVDVVLDERIAWTVRMDGGVKRGMFAMAGGKVGDFYFEGGADRLELTLPRQERQIEIRMAGGVHRWTIGTEGEFPVRVKIRKGAGSVDLNGDRDEGVDRGRTLRAQGSDTKSGGLRIEAVAGIGSLSVAPLEA
ncbi:hypothetical protein M1L60_26780 [Actinoplanes sp. TRM 88003]|uniref:Adhesin domain-containing protein n=1 Tax=Paractinoplanes aksuensis TaxID=2939490 RepID=A0ABT1DX52_9ACTN|nr:hypothetical protein [Actinoplanes aksuensis]MCO8274211.1 hypothetical protein [Actinoplanes aksuensis]